MFLDEGDDFDTITLSRSDFSGLPSKLKMEVEQAADTATNSVERIEFIFANRAVAELLFEKLRRYEKNRDSAKRRRFLERTQSTGIYTASDIEEIFAAQDGLCYFSGQLLSRNERNYSIDHLRPVKADGTSWPGNLALVLKAVNQEKQDLSVRKYWAILGKRYGVEWVRNRLLFCQRVDAKRKIIDRKRKVSVRTLLSEMELQLQETFPENEIDYCLLNDEVTLFVDFVSVRFPPGFLRERRKCASPTYLTSIVSAVIGSTDLTLKKTYQDAPVL